ncbi:MAG: MCE family protein [Chlorobiota bacterium]|nr:MCE family protein [Chlorobiota bacterium]QQS66972.1 MAG: MCE family protein [Chlorobiota bacterium]
MSANRSQEIKVGLITLIALLSVIGIIIWGKSAGLGVNNKTLSIILPSSNGIEAGAPVTVYGVRCGSVISVTISENKVIANAVIQSSIKLYSNARASVQMLELTGGRKIEIEPGDSGKEVKDDILIKGYSQGDISSSISKVDLIVTDAQIMIKKLDTTISSINGIVSSPAFKQSITNSLSNTEKASLQLNEVITQNKDAIKKTLLDLQSASVELKNTINEISPIAKNLITNANGAVTEISGNVKSVSASTENTLKSANETILKINSLTENLNKITEGINNKDGIIGRLVFDKKLSDDIDLTIKETKELVTKIRKYGINTNVSIGQKP